MMKKLIFLLLLCFLCYTNSKAQPVTLSGKQFFVGEEAFYPMVMNYYLDWVLKGDDFFLSPHLCYGANTYDYECDDEATCSAKMQTDFDYIAGMGFNALRVMYRPMYISGRGLAFYYKRHALISEDDYGYFDVDPTVSSDPGMLTVLPFYDQILELAHNASLKVILCMSGISDTLDKTEIDLRSDFLSILSTHLSNSIYSDALMAYDLINEPSYVLRKNPKTKQEACEIVSTWYNIIKANDPAHLITIGNYSIEDIFSFDPSILKVDFNSVHYYPSFKPYEDRTDSRTQALARQRTANLLYWFNRASIVPWIVGETGFTASGSHGIEEGLDGTLAHQGAYVQYSLEAICNCGGGGFSWWQYQDVWWGDTPEQNYLGLLEAGISPSPSAEKQPAVDHIRNYTPAITGNCPTDYTPIFDTSRLYYNPYGYPRNPGKEIESCVVDQDGNPIKDAVVYVWTDMGNDTIKIVENEIERDSIFPRSDLYVTYTDTCGKFIALPCHIQYGFMSTPPAEIPGIAQIQVSAAGAETKKYGQWVSLSAPPIIKLEIINYDVIVNGETIFNGQTKTYSGRKSLTVSNTTVRSGGSATFTSQRSITLYPGFTALAGSHVNMYMAHSGCDELALFNSPNILHAPPYPYKETEIEPDEESKVLELSFDTDVSGNTISVFPNPATGTVTIQLHSNNTEATLTAIKLYDIFGRVIFTQPANGNSQVLDTSAYSKGVYFIEAKDGVTTYYQKIIIQ